MIFINFALHSQVSTLFSIPEQDDASPDSQKVEDYTFKHTLQEIEEYKDHADAFYLLMCTVHGSASLTGYMMKLVDAVPHLLTSLPFNLGRASTEGSESSHYFRTKVFFWYRTSFAVFFSLHKMGSKNTNNNKTIRATSRGGGRGESDPFNQIFQRQYRIMKYTAKGECMSSAPSGVGRILTSLKSREST